MPNTILYLCKNVPFDINYKHTLLFKEIGDQQAYFYGKKWQQYNNLTYVRVNENTLSVQVSRADAERCNYVCFKNLDESNKWYYGFITSVKYVSPNTTEIVFKLDILQTYMFDFRMGECFVQRETPDSDDFGEHLQSEPIADGDVICHAVKTKLFTKYDAVVATAYDPDGQAGSMRGGLVSGLSYLRFDIDTESDVEDLFDYLNTATSKMKDESIVCIFYMPSWFHDEEGDLKPDAISMNVSRPSKIGTYTPRNKKLLTFPFNYLVVEDGNNDATFKYEYFTESTARFELSGSTCCNPQIACSPTNYMNTDTNYNWTEKLVISGFPQIGFAIDSYRAWVAQQGTAHTIRSVADMAKLGTSIGGAIMGDLGGLVSSAERVALNANEYAIAKNLPPQARGQQSNDIDIAWKRKGFYFKQMGVPEWKAKIIDDWFDKYGYSCNKLKVPTLQNRSNWTYLKTSEAFIITSLPYNIREELAKVFNTGVTFWHDQDYYGDYSQKNAFIR